METKRYLEELDRPAQVQQTFSQGLATWGTFSWMLGAGLYALGWRRNGPFARGLALQLAGWGVANLAIAMLGLRDASKARPVEGPARRRRLNRLLKINQWLDAVYLIVAGALLVLGLQGKRATARTLLGHAAGVGAQGAFLLGFDRAFKRALRQ